MGNFASDSGSRPAAVHARIARTLTALADPRGAVSTVQIPAYVRRHLPEHAAAGGNLDVYTVPTALLPYLDVTRLREVASAAELPLMTLVRKAAHAWAWDRPGQNAAALRFLAAAGRFPIPKTDLPTPWNVAWAKSAGPSEILARIDSVGCVDAISLDDRIIVVTGARSGRVDLWDMSSGQSVQLPNHAVGVNAVTVSTISDDNLLIGAGGDDGIIRCWIIRWTAGWPTTWHDAQQIGVFDVGDAVTALSPAHLLSEWHMLAGQADGYVSLLDCTTGDRHDRLIHEGEVTGITTTQLANDDSVLVSVSIDGTLQVSKLDDQLSAVGSRVRADEAIRAVIVLPHQNGGPIAATAGDRGSVQLWDLPPRPGASRTVPGHTEDITMLAAGMESQYGMLFVSGDCEGRLRIVNANEARIVGEPIEAHRKRVTGLAFARSRNRRPIIVSAGGDATVRRWDLGAAISENPHSNRPAASSGDSSSTTKFQDSLIRVWRLDDGRELGQEESNRTHRMAAVATARLADGTTVAITDGGCSTAADSHRTVAVSAANLPTGRTLVVSASAGGCLYLWDLTDYGDFGHFRPLGEPLVHRGVQSVVTAVRADGRVVAISAGRDRNLRIWNMSSAERSGDVLAGHERAVTALAVAASTGRPTVVISGSEDTTLRMWNVDTGAQIGPTIRGHQRHITALAAAYIDGAITAITGCAGDSVVRVWKLSDRGLRPQLLTQHKGQVTAIAISATDTGSPAVITAGEDRTLRVWDLVSAAPLTDPMPVPGTVRAISCFAGAHPGAIVAGDDVLAVVHW